MAAGRFGGCGLLGSDPGQGAAVATTGLLETVTYKVAFAAAGEY